MGPGTLEVQMELFEENRRRLVEQLRAKELKVNAVVLLQGGSDIPFYDTDTTYVFRQVKFIVHTFAHLFKQKKLTKRLNRPVVCL